MPAINSWTIDEESVFDKLGVAKDDATLRMLIRGQRRINGRIFEALTVILNSFPTQNLDPESLRLLAEAKDIVRVIPGEDPPFCEPSTKGS